MIKTIELQNIYGIKKHLKLDFQLNHLKDSQIGIENGVIKVKDSKILLTPTFIGRNASGKTSILKAIAYSSKFKNLEQLKDFLFMDGIKYIQKIKLDFNLYDKKYLNYNWIRMNELLRAENFEEHKFSAIKGLLLFFIRRFLNDEYEYEWELLNMNFDDQNTNIQKIKIHFKKILNQLKANVRAKFCASLFKNKELIFKQGNNELLPLEIKVVFDNNFTKHIFISDQEIIFNQDKTTIKDVLLEYEEKLTHILEQSHIFRLLNLLFKIKHFEQMSLFRNNLEKEAFQNEEIKIDLNEKKNEYNFIDDNIIRNAFKKMEEMNDFNTMIKRLIKKYSFNFVNKLITKLDTTISHLELETNNNYTIKDKRHQMKRSFATLSFGTLKILYIISTISFSKKNNIVLIDEIENGLNISLISFLFKCFQDDIINKNNIQMFVSTHSANLFEKEIINVNNAFIYINDTFVKPHDEDAFKRTEDKKSIFLSKNYYNKIFWNKKYPNAKVSTNSIDIIDKYDLIDSLEDDFE